MSRKNLARLIGAALALAGSNAVLACSTAAWTTTGSGGADVGAVVGSPLASEPDEAGTANDVARYSGRCGLQATAANNYVRDASPNGESTYRARFYVFTGVSGGEAIVFRAQNAALTDRIRVGTTGTAINFYADTDATADATVAVSANRWYSVEVNHTGSGTPSVAYTVQGAATNYTTPAALTGSFPITAGVIDRAELGWISSNGAAAGKVLVDAFESRRTTAIGRLRRADSDASGVCNSGDITATARDILSILLNGAGANAQLASGQPDCNEDGAINSGDITCTAQVIIGDLLSPAPKTVCGAAP